MGGEAPEPRRLSRALSFGCGGIPDKALHLVMGYVDDPRDREAASLVCRRWHRIDALTRKHVTVAFCYAADPSRLCARFPLLESLALKGRPRVAMYGLIPEDWGAYAAPWVSELAEPLECLKALHLRRMTVTDADLAALVRARGHMLQELKLDKCSGFSTDALRLVARSCRSLRTLFLEECLITDKGGKWLHELAVNNSVLVILNFYMTDLKVAPADLELLAKNFKSLISLKMNYDDRTKPIYLYINSTGTMDENNELVASETDAYAIADFINRSKSKVYTINLSMAYGQAAMLLSLGVKGKRGVLPNSITKLYLPKVHKSGGAAIDMWIKAKELDTNTDYYLDILSRGVGKPKEELAEFLKGPRYFRAQEAIDYGLADTILHSLDGSFKPKDLTAQLAKAQEMRQSGKRAAAGAGRWTAPAAPR